MLKGIMYYCKCGKRTKIDNLKCQHCREPRPEYSKLSKYINFNGKRKWVSTEKPVSLVTGREFNKFFYMSIYDALEFFEKATLNANNPEGYLNQKEHDRTLATVASVWEQFIQTRDLSNTKPVYDGFKAAFSNRYIRDIEADEVELFLKNLAAERNASTNTYKHYHSYISAFFTFCMKRKRIIQFNPCSAIEAGKPIQKMPFFLYPSEFRDFYEVCRTSRSDRLLVSVLLCTHTGARANEVEKLKFDDIDWHARTVKLQSKGCPERKVEITLPLYSLLKKYCKDHEISYDDFIIRTNNGKRVFPRSGFESARDKMIDNGFKRFSHLTVHKLRHTYATWLYAKTKDILLVKEKLGHTDIHTTMIYTHLLNSEIDKIMDGDPFDMM